MTQGLTYHCSDRSGESHILQVLPDTSLLLVVQLGIDEAPRIDLSWHDRKGASYAQLLIDHNLK